MYQQQVVATVYEYDNGCSQLWPDGLTAIGAFLGNVCIHHHWRPAYATILRVAVPVEQLVAFARLEIKRTRKLVVRLP